MSESSDAPVPEHVLVVGAGLAGSRLVQELKRLEYAGRITLIGDEVHHPYDRPPLSKQVLAGTKTVDDVALATPESLAGVEVLLERRVEHVAPGVVTLDDGSTLQADAIVVATGVRARVPDGVQIGGALHVLRTRDDAVRLKDALDDATSLLVLGGGFIGAEVAAAGAQGGLEVTIVEARDSLLGGALPAEVGAVVADLHRDHGVDVRTGVAVADIADRDGRAVATLADGTVLEADLAVIGFGTEIDDEPLIDLPSADPGVLCDADGRVEGVPGVYAIGDVAAWFDAPLAGAMRREHWSSASDHAAALAHTLVRAEPPGFVVNAIPYFWSDEYDVKIQVLGRPQLADRGAWVADHDAGPQSVYELHRGDELVGVITLGIPRLVVPYRRQMMNPT